MKCHQEKCRELFEELRVFNRSLQHFWEPSFSLLFLDSEGLKNIKKRRLLLLKEIAEYSQALIVDLLGQREEVVRLCRGISDDGPSVFSGQESFLLRQDSALESKRRHCSRRRWRHLFTFVEFIGLKSVSNGWSDRFDRNICTLFSNYSRGGYHMYKYPFSTPLRSIEKSNFFRY